MARLLAAEEAALARERLEDVAVADRRRDHLDAVFRHERVEPEIRHDRHGDDVDAEVECEHGNDLVSVDGLAALVDGEHPVAVAVECDTEVETLGA